MERIPKNPEHCLGMMDEPDLQRSSVRFTVSLRFYRRQIIWSLRILQRWWFASRRGFVVTDEVRLALSWYMNQGVFTWTDKRIIQCMFQIVRTYPHRFTHETLDLSVIFGAQVLQDMRYESSCQQFGMYN